MINKSSEGCVLDDRQAAKSKAFYFICCRLSPPVSVLHLFANPLLLNNKRV